MNAPVGGHTRHLDLLWESRRAAMALPRVPLRLGWRPPRERGCGVTPSSRIRCAVCGSLRVRRLVWQDPNTGAVEVASRGHATWCEECCEHVELVGRHRRDGSVLQRLEREGVDGLLRRLCAEAGVSTVEVVSRGRRRHIVAVRRAFWSLLRDRDWSLPRIGKAFGVHHTTVLEGVRVHRANLCHEAAE